MTGPGARAELVERALTVLFAGALGLGWWFLAILAGSDDLAVFWPGTALSVIALTWLTPGDPRALAAGTGVAPFLVAGSTTPVGDDDGLWVSIFLFLVVWTAILLALAIGVQSLKRWLREHRSSPGRRPTPRVLLVEALVVALAVTGALWLRAEATAGPWADLEARLATYPVPAGFTAGEAGLVRHGSPRCSSSCTPELSLRLGSTLGVAATCRTLKESLARWTHTPVVGDSPEITVDADWEGCSYTGTHRRADRTREIQAYAGSEPGQPLEVEVTVVEECALTC